MEVLYNKNGECRSGSRCKKYRVCEECNKIRQANIANVTELASRFSANARYSVVMPFNEGQDPQLINKLKTRITRKLRKSVDGTFISVETSANDALHLNLSVWALLGQSLVSLFSLVMLGVLLHIQLRLIAFHLKNFMLAISIQLLALSVLLGILCNRKECLTMLLLLPLLLCVIS